MTERERRKGRRGRKERKPKRKGEEKRENRNHECSESQDRDGLSKCKSKGRSIFINKQIDLITQKFSAHFLNEKNCQPTN